MDPVAQQKCVVCSRSCSRHCQKCKQAYYCSTVCQKEDWQIHKLFCEALSEFDRSDRPNDDHFLACSFPAHGNRPQLIWLSCQWHEDEDGRHQLPHFDSELGLDREIPIQYNQMRRQRLPNTLCICHRDGFLIDGSETNKSILSVIKKASGPRHDWRGPIVAYSRRGPGLDPPMCRDLDINDLRHISDYFLWYGCDTTPKTEESNQIMIHSVRINCFGDQMIHGRPRFEAVEVAATDPIFTKHYTSDIAERVGIPLYTQSCALDMLWMDERHSPTLEGHDPFTNQDAAFLHLCCNPNAGFDSQTGSLGWGWAPQKWQNNVGSILVVRQDKKPLLPLHVEALCDFCRREVRPVLAHSIGEYDPEIPMSRDSVLAMICRAKFVITWYNFLDRKREDGENYQCSYPFDV